MHCLAIETSGFEGRVALWSDGECIERALETAGRRHAQSLIAEIDALVRTAGLTPAALNLVAVSLGPGSFTGLRVGVMAAKTLAYALGIPVVGIETFSTFAAQAPAEWGSVAVVGDAQRGDYFLGEARFTTERGWETTGPVRIVSAVEWLGELSADLHVIGPALAKPVTATTAATLVREPWATIPSACRLAELGVARFTRHGGDDPWSIAPIYLRPSAAEEQRDRRDALATGGK